MASFDLENKEFENKVNPKSKKWGIITIILCSVLFLVLFTTFLPNIQKFLLGLFGVFVYPLVLVLFVIGVALVNNKKYIMPKKYIVLILTLVYLILGVINTIILGKPDITFGQYLVQTYNSITAGGILAGLLSGALLYTLGVVGTIVLYTLAIVVFVALIIDFLNSVKVYGLKNVIKEKDQISKIEVEKEIKKTKQIKKQETLSENKLKTYNDEDDDFNLFIKNKMQNENKVRDAKVKLGLIDGNIDSAKRPSDPQSLRDYILEPPPFPETYLGRSLNNRKNREREIQKNIQSLKEEKVNSNNNFTSTKIVQSKFDDLTTESQNNSNQPSASDFQQNNIQNDNSMQKQNILKNEIDEAEDNISENSDENFNDDFGDNIEYVSENDYSNDTLDDTIRYDDNDYESDEYFNQDSGVYEDSQVDENIPTQPKQKKFAELDVEESNSTNETKHEETVYVRPPIDLLEKYDVDMNSVNENVYEKSRAIEEVMQEFNIPAKVVGVVVGPAVTKFELEMPHGVSVKKILGLTDDISLALAAKSKIRIEAPVPGKSVVGIEVPNDNITMVSMRELVESDEFRVSKSPIAFALGKSITGDNILCNINKMPHLLIAGATNSGKSVCLNAILLSILYKASPDDVRLILIDPKCVEFSMYNGLPHLLMPNVITEVDKAINALNWAVNEMEQRFRKLQEYRCRNIDEFNSSEDVQNGTEKKMPYIVIMIDELNDLMSTNKKEVEEKIMRLAQKARASGIHLIIATQRPSVDVITGTIKANFPSRISFALTSYADSKTILEMSGAENLLGHGDMLYKPSDVNFPLRIQGCYVDKTEVEKVVEFIKEHNSSSYDEKIEQSLSNEQSNNAYSGAVNGDKNWDPLLPQVLKMFIQNGKATISAAQRRFVIGFPRAGRIIDQLAELGYISQGEGSKPRAVNITMQEFYNKFGDID